MCHHDYRPHLSNYQVETTTLQLGATSMRVRALRDRQQFDDDDGQAARAGISSAAWPLFGLVWPAGIALAQVMATLPVTGRRVLEVGCGIGLSSMVLHSRGADVTASDHHPLAEEFLRHNTALNQLPEIPYVNAAWQDVASDLGAFDLIIGSDLLYERDQPALLAGFIARHAKPAAQVILSDPGRSECGRFSALLATQGYTRNEPWPRFATETGALATRGRILNFLRAGV